jgi:hypothetical protein
MKYVTGGFVSEEEAGQRLFQVMHDPRASKSGVYWSWNGGPREGRGAEAIEKGGQIMGAGGAGGGWDSIFENDQSDKVLDVEKARKLWEYSSAITGAAWPSPNQPKSPCPTLSVVGAVTDLLNKKEELDRMQRKDDGNVAGRKLQGGGGGNKGVGAPSFAAKVESALGALPTEALEESLNDGSKNKQKIAF